VPLVTPSAPSPCSGASVSFGDDEKGLHAGDAVGKGAGYWKSFRKMLVLVSSDEAAPVFWMLDEDAGEPEWGRRVHEWKDGKDSATADALQ
jgi:hypothetical protein